MFAALWCEDFDRLLLCLHHCCVMIFDRLAFAGLWCKDFDRLVLCLQHCGVKVLTDSCCVCSAVV